MDYAAAATAHRRKPSAPRLTVRHRLGYRARLAPPVRHTPVTDGWTLSMALACCTFHIRCGVSFSYGRRFTAVRDFLQGQMTSMDKAANVVLDIEGLPQQPDKCCTGSPKMTRALSRKGSNRMERRSGEEQEQDDLVKKLIIKVVPSQLEQLKMPLVQNKALVTPQSQCAACAPILTDSGEGRNKKFNRLTSVHPRKILLFFATLSSVGTMILIYFTLAINGGKAEA
ncbi:hypothetical protein OsJ_16586 [Oryza sativa Japonica Group]|uniref:Uncharacterized protein n=1 Tax=Oryza sativa subsp. japonica TaxID=39947 RepID=B9FD92_ORYSJ|nr:hypothetical protein OsJ_16586 [Oryza sativa Japonica Group]